MWVSIAGLLSGTVLNIKSKRPIIPLINFAEHALFGAVCSAIITKIGDDSLFPDQDVAKEEKISVIYTNPNSSDEL